MTKITVHYYPCSQPNPCPWPLLSHCIASLRGRHHTHVVQKVKQLHGNDRRLSLFIRAGPWEISQRRILHQELTWEQGEWREYVPWDWLTKNPVWRCGLWSWRQARRCRWKAASSSYASSRLRFAIRCGFILITFSLFHWSFLIIIRNLCVLRR